MSKSADDPVVGPFERDCPGRAILEHVMSRWGSLALLVLRERAYRFRELRRRIGGGVSEKMLAQTLRTLEDDGFVSRRDFEEVPPRVEYTLTPMGREVAGHVAVIGRWVSDHAPQVIAERERRQAAPRRRSASL